MKSFWIFEYFNTRNIDPFQQNLLDVEASEMREPSYDPKTLIKWNANGIYTIQQKNPYFQFTFLKYPIYITKYKLLSKGGNNLCSPYGLSLEASLDSASYTTLHKIEGYLCDAEKCINKVTKEFDVTNFSIGKYIKMTQYGGECNTPDSHFGLVSIDFYGFYVSTPQICGRFSFTTAKSENSHLPPF